MQWRWIQREALVRLHAMCLVQFGGLAGLRDERLLGSALSRPEQLAHYGSSDVADIAAAYAFELAKIHPFADGNKRTAFFGAEFVFASEWLSPHRLTARGNANDLVACRRRAQ